MSLWTKTDGADTADTVVNVTTTTASRTVTTATTAAIKEQDAISGTGIPAGSTVTHVIDGLSFTINAPATASATVSATVVHKNVNKPKFQTVVEQKATYGVDPNEAKLKPVTHTGWVKVTDGSGSRAGRRLYETIVAMGSIVTDAEDVMFADPTITISAQPTATTIRLASGVTNLVPVTFGATVSVTGNGLVPTYQWTVSDTSAGVYTNVVDVAGTTGIAGATTNTLVLKSKAVNTKFYKLVVSVVTPILGPLTSTSNAAKVIGSQVTESITWTAGVATVTTAINHALVNTDSVIVAGFTPTDYNGTHTVTVTGVNTFTFTLPSATAIGASTIQGTATKIVSHPTTSLTWALDVATVTVTGNHNYGDGDTITVAGVTPAAYNVTAAITVTGVSTFTYALVVADPGAASVQGTVTRNAVLAHPTTSLTWALDVATVTTTAANHGYITGQPVLVAGVTPAAYNGNYTVTVTGLNTFTYALVVADPGAVSIQGTVTQIASGSAAAWTPNFATVTATGHALIATNQVTIFGVTPAAYNGTFTVLPGPGANTFTFDSIVSNPGAASVQGELYKVVA